MTRFFFIAASILAAATAAAQARPPSAPTETGAERQTPESGKTREQVLQELITARAAGETWRGNAEPPAFKLLNSERSRTDAPASTQDVSPRDR